VTTQASPPTDRQRLLAAGDLESLLPSWQLHMASRNLSPKTQRTYLDAARGLVRHLTAAGMPRHAAGLRREHVESYIAELLTRSAPANASTHYRALQQLFKWLIDDGEITESPMAKMRPPKVPESLIPVIDDGALGRLFAVCDGRGFVDRRDRAVMLVLLDTGVRLAGLAGLTLDDVDLHGQRALRVRLKGGRELLLPLGTAALKGLDRYLRERSRHPHAGLPWLWLGERGRLGNSGIYQMLRRRGREAGVEGLHPHRFRHTFAHTWLASGGSEQNLMALAGWSSNQMLGRYGRSAREERARAAHREASPADRLLGS
jgi:site-specific recombinase XerD